MSKIPRPVWLLGWTSFFTDAGSEMIYSLLPVFLSQVLGAGATSLGIIEGLAEGVNSVLKIVSGRLSDRVSRRKRITIAGYALSSAIRPFIALATSWTQVLAIRVADRTGKGIRGAPRDAMLAQFATPETRGRIFGFHSAMDHAGAIVGPLFAAVFLLFMPGKYRVLFALSAIPGALAVWALVRVPEAGPDVGRVLSDPASSGRRVQKDPAYISSEKDPAYMPLPRRFYALIAVLLLFSLGNSADAFLLLRLSKVLGNAAYIPLLWAMLHVVKAGLSVYGGNLSDRIGRKAIIVSGWVAYALVYVGFAIVQSAAGLIACFLAYGIYFGLAEGSEKALVTDLSPARLRGTAFGFYNGALGMGALVASVLFGWLYDTYGSPAAFGTGAALAGAAALALVMLPTHRLDERATATDH